MRDVEPDDLPIFFEHQRDPVAVAMVVFRSRDRAEFDEHWAKILADDACLKKTIVADGQVAGNIGSFGRDGKREVGYWIDRTVGAWHCQRGARCVSPPGTEPATLRRCGSTQRCIDTRPTKMWLHLMQEAKSIRNRSSPASRTFFSGSEKRVEAHFRRYAGRPGRAQPVPFLPRLQARKRPAFPRCNSSPASCISVTQNSYFFLLPSHFLPASPSAFAQVFRRVVGVTPTQFRGTL